MATRFRLTQDTTAPAVSPALGGYTHEAPATVRRKLLTSDSSALTNTDYTPDTSDDGAAGTALWCQFVSDPMVASKVFADGDAIKYAIQGLEAHVNNNLFVAAFIRIVSEDGTTVRRTLNTGITAATELTTSLRNSSVSGQQSAANYTTVSGDRLSVEVYVTGDPGTGGGVQGHNSTMRFGGDGAGGDLPENDTETGTTFNPWIEFVPSDLFSAGTNANAGNAAGTGTSFLAAVALSVSAALASGTGSAFNASISVQPNAGNAAGTSTAYAVTATVSFTSGVATGTGTAYNATGQILKDVTAGLASGTGSAFGAAPSVGPSPSVAAGTGTAYTASANIQPNAGNAAGTGTAYDATVTISAGTDVFPGVAAGTGAAYLAGPSVAPSAGLAAGTGTAYNASVSVQPNAANAAGTGTAYAVTETIQVNAAVGAGTGTAYDATVSVSSGTNANAEVAAGTGTAYGTTATISFTAGVATGTGTAPQASADIAPNAGFAAGTGTAYGVSLLVPIWTTPADTDTMAASPELKFTMPALASPQHFHIQLDTATTFDTGNLRNVRSDLDQTGWDFWNGTGWEAVPAGGVSSAYNGNEARHTVQTPLAGGTWYRRVRAGV